MSNEHRTPTTRNTRTPQQIAAEQRAQAERDAKARSARPKAAPAPAGEPTTAVATVASKQVVPDTRDPVTRYVDDIAPASFPGRLIKFTREGRFTVTETGDEIASVRDFVALADETLIGWIKFSDEEGQPPERIQGLLFDGFAMPPREALGDLDEADWPAGLSGAPEDPWLHQMALVLEDRETHDLYTFTTTSKTGRRAIGNLLRHYARLQRSNPDSYPIVRLRGGGFNHRDDRIGWVHVPTFAVVGRAPKASAAVPDSSIGTDLSDSLPF